MLNKVSTAPKQSRPKHSKNHNESHFSVTGESSSSSSARGGGSGRRGCWGSRSGDGAFNYSNDCCEHNHDCMRVICSIFKRNCKELVQLRGLVVWYWD